MARPAGDPPNAFRDEARRVGADLAARIDAAWALSPPAQARETAALARRCEASQIYVSGLVEHPAQGVRLARLFVRHRKAMKPKLASAAMMSLTWIGLGQDAPELDQLALEMVESEDRALSLSANPFLLSRGALHEVMPGLGFSLARLLADAARPPAVRVKAAQWLAYGAWPQAVPALKKALRENRLELRDIALAVLLEMGRLEADDACFLVADAVERPILDLRDWDLGYDYQQNVGEALRKLRPAGAAEALEALTLGEVPGDPLFLHQRWALPMLALVDPERALPIVDERLREGAAYEREPAAEAAAELPRALALPRLARAAIDPVPRIARDARKAYRRVAGRPLPAGDPPAPVQLAGPKPSKRFRAELRVALRGEDGERKALAARLLREKAEGLSMRRERERAVVLVHLLMDERCVPKARNPPRGLWGRAAWIDRLARRPGSVAVDALLFYLPRYPGGGTGNLVEDVKGLHARGRLDARQLAQARRDLAALLDSPFHRERWNAHYALSDLGGPASAFARLVAAMEGGDPDFTTPAWFALRRGAPSPAFDARVASELELARERRDWSRFERWARIGIGRRAARATQLAWEAVEACGGEEVARQLGGVVADFKEFQALPAGWAERILADPADPRFHLALYAIPSEFWSPMDGRYRVLLEAALDGPPRAAREAAMRLVGAGALKLDDPRLRALYDRLEWQERELLLLNVSHRGIAGWEETLRDALKRVDPNVAALIAGNLRRHGGEAIARSVLDEVGPELAAEIRDGLGELDLEDLPGWSDDDG